MKILYFYQYFSTPKGSWGTRVYEFAAEWVKLGHDVTVITSIYTKSNLKATRFIENHEYDGIKVKIINVLIDNKQNLFNRILSFLNYSIIASWYAIVLKTDIVIASSGPITVGIPGLIAKYLRGRVLVFEVRDLWPEGAIELGIIRNPIVKYISYWFEKKCYEASSLIVALSPGIKKYIINKNNHTNVIDVTNGANIPLFTKEYKFNLPLQLSRRKYAIYTGNIGKVNNSEWLLNTAVELKKLNRSDLKILIIGDGPDKQKIETKANQYRLDNLIIFGLIPKDELVPYIQNALVSLVPLLETPVLDTSSPNKFFESLAAGVPVIQNSNGWMKEFLAFHNIGFTIDSRDPLLLARKLIELDESPHIVDEMRNRSKLIAAKEFDKKILSDKMLNSILNLV
jgi:glycosyltransferase involved in cell wall biosynthesis